MEFLQLSQDCPQSNANAANSRFPPRLNALASTYYLPPFEKLDDAIMPSYRFSAAAIAAPGSWHVSRPFLSVHSAASPHPKSLSPEHCMNRST
ncbi:hypothetical protein GGE09_003606 [Roseobacter sp. N2S]|nr:hypothetical protein [Roseobacter sp. N2S]